MKNSVFLITLLLLAACSTPEERAQREEQKEISECIRSGYQPNTPAFDDCRSQVKEIEEQKMADRIKAGNDASSLQNSRSGSLPSGMSIPIQ